MTVAIGMVFLLGLLVFVLGCCKAAGKADRRRGL